MAVDFKNSETKDNLMRAFAGESQARNRYTFAAGQAKKENLQVIAAVLKYTADQEKEHAEIFYNHLKELAGETIHVDGGYPVDISENVLDLLKKAQHNDSCGGKSIMLDTKFFHVYSPDYFLHYTTVWEQEQGLEPNK